MSSIDHLHSETEILQVEDHLKLLSAQYLVQCLDTENVCHHITKMDLPPMEMKETIFTRHYQTVSPLLANNRKDTLQALHTSFVNTAIGNMKDNRVLNSRPPSINDEKLFYRDDKGQLYHSSVLDIVNSWIPTKSDWSKVILQDVQTVEWIHRMYLTCSIA